MDCSRRYRTPLQMTLCIIVSTETYTVVSVHLASPPPVWTSFIPRYYSRLWKTHASGTCQSADYRVCTSVPAAIVGQHVVRVQFIECYFFRVLTCFYFAFNIQWTKKKINLALHPGPDIFSTRKYQKLLRPTLHQEWAI